MGSGPPHWYENLAARSRRSSLIIDPPDGRLPALTEEAKRRAAAAEAVRKSRGPSDSWEDRSLWDRCITVGLPAVMVPTGYNNNVQILQAPGYVTVTHEMMHDTRIIPLDGRPHVSPTIRGYYGDSRAHWEGTTLVIDVTNFHPKVSYGHMAGNRAAGDTFHIIERYTRVGRDEVRYEVTIDDPQTLRASVDGCARSGRAGGHVRVRAATRAIAGSRISCVRRGWTTRLPRKRRSSCPVSGSVLVCDFYFAAQPAGGFHGLPRGGPTSSGRPGGSTLSARART